MEAPPRTARLVLVSPGGEVLGTLPPVPVASPWWQDIAPVVEAVRRHHGVEVTILRLLEGQRAAPPGGEVTYVAEVDGPVDAAPFEGALADHPLRAAYARPGGPAADLAWAREVLAGRGLEFTAPPAQIRTWNLSSLWRLRTQAGPAWLKVLPAFIAREARLLAYLAEERVPVLLGGAGQRVLMADIAGRDLYGATSAEILEMVDLLVDLQARRIGRESELLALGLADWRAPALIAAIRSVIERAAGDLEAGELAMLQRFADDLPRRMEAVAACGLSHTLIHGDFQGGNVRGESGALTLIDWGEGGVGHPLLDQAAMFENIAADQVAPVRAHWADRWRQAVPGSDPMAGFALLRPVAVAKQAAVYQGFLDNIEPSEHPYHRADPAERLKRTAALLRAEASSTLENDLGASR
ncbi:MAG TPA: aminoglycoside phosphotransferase family protein [Caulobacteraceae bacterium]